MAIVVINDPDILKNEKDAQGSKQPKESPGVFEEANQQIYLYYTANTSH